MVACTQSNFQNGLEPFSWHSNTGPRHFLFFFFCKELVWRAQGKERVGKSIQFKTAWVELLPTRHHKLTKKSGWTYVNSICLPKFKFWINTDEDEQPLATVALGHEFNTKHLKYKQCWSSKIHPSPKQITSEYFFHYSVSLSQVALPRAWTVALKWRDGICMWVALNTMTMPLDCCSNLSQLVWVCN